VPARARPPVQASQTPGWPQPDGWGSKGGWIRPLTLAAMPQTRPGSKARAPWRCDRRWGALTHHSSSPIRPEGSRPKLSCSGRRSRRRRGHSLGSSWSPSASRPSRSIIRTGWRACCSERPARWAGPPASADPHSGSAHDQPRSGLISTAIRSRGGRQHHGRGHAVVPGCRREAGQAVRGRVEDWAALPTPKSPMQQAPGKGA